MRNRQLEYDEEIEEVVGVIHPRHRQPQQWDSESKNLDNQQSDGSKSHDEINPFVRRRNHRRDNSREWGSKDDIRLDMLEFDGKAEGDDFVGLDPNSLDSRVLTNGSFRNPWKFVSQGLNRFSMNMSWKVGDGSSIWFWKDIWCGVRTFEQSFPRIFNLSSCPNAFVADLLSRDSNNNSNWDFGFRRDPTDRELEEILSLLQLLETWSFNPSIPDKRVWWIFLVNFFFLAPCYYTWSDFFWTL